MNRPKTEQEEPILLLIDGDCNLCHWITRFVIKRDPAKQFMFASIQSLTGQQLLRQGGLSTDDMDTFVMVQGTNFYTKSTAALRVLRKLNGLWPLAYGFMVVPLFVRNKGYDLIAKRRYRWFGKQDRCMMPTAEVRSRFVE